MQEQFRDSPEYYLFGMIHELWALIMEGRLDEARALHYRSLDEIQKMLGWSEPAVQVEIGSNAVVLGLFDDGIALLQPVLMSDPMPTAEDSGHDEVYGYLYLHHALIETGDEERADAVAQIIETILEERRHFDYENDDSGSVIAEYMVNAALMSHAGDFGAARNVLEQAIGLGWRSYYEIRNDPLWAAALKDPGIRELMDRVVADLAEQRARVEAANAEHDFKAEAEAALARQEEGENRG